MDVTASTHWASEAIEVQGPRRYFTPADNQSMGWAIPAAIGAQRVRPDRQVVCVTGDGCFLMSAIEMSTAARAGLPVKFFVFDDGAYHYMQMLQEPVYRRTTATEIARIDYAAFAQGVGLGYNQIAGNADVARRHPARPGDCPARSSPTSIVSYEGREIRWLNALRSHYIDKLPQRPEGPPGRPDRRPSTQRPQRLTATDRARIVVDSPNRSADPRSPVLTFRESRRCTVRCRPVAARIGDGAAGRTPAAWMGRRRDMDVRTSSLRFPHAEFFPPPPAPRGPSRLAGRGCATIARELVRFWPVIQNMVVQELRVRYQRSILGFFWTLLNPILMMVILSLGLLPALSAGSRTTRSTSSPGMVPWGFLSGSLERLRVLHHPERRADPEDLPAQAGLPAGAGADQPGDVRALAGGPVPAAVAAGGPALAADAPAAGGDRALLALFTLGLGLIVATANTFYPRLRPPGLGVPAGLVLRDADPLPSRAVPERGAVAVPAESGVLRSSRCSTTSSVDGRVAAARPRCGRRRDRGGEPGDRLCHIQVSRRQDGLPTLSRRGGRTRRPHAAPRPADRAARRLAPVRQLRRQAVLAQARRARPGAAPRGAGAGRPSSGPCATST